MEELQKAIAFLEELQDCQNRPLRHGIQDAQGLINDKLEYVVEGLKQFQIDLEKQNDLGCNQSH